MKRKFIGLVLAGLFGATGQVAQADIIYTLAEGAGGIVDMNIEASGTTTATADWFLLIGDATTDSFLLADTPQRNGTAPIPNLSLGGCTAQNNFYRDDGATTNYGVESLLGFFFGGDCLNGLIDLTDLNGDYVLPSSIFSDFVIGTYTGLIAGITSFTLQGLGDITVVVEGPASVPEPGTLALLGIGLFGMGLSRRKKV